VIKTFREKAIIQAEQFDGGWAMAKKYSLDNSATTSNKIKPKFYVPTLEGRLQVYVGDWIATGVNGEHWAISDEVFQKTYAELTVIPKIVADVIEFYHREYSLGMLFSDSNDEDMSDEFLDYFYEDGNPEIIARAWLDGYQIEEEDK